MDHVATSLLLALADPVQAAGTVVTEPSTLALFALGIVGVIVGRHGSRGKRD